MTIVMHGVVEYVERYPIELDRVGGCGRWVIRAYNEGRYSCTEVDVLDLVHWLRENMPECLEPTQERSIVHETKVNNG